MDTDSDAPKGKCRVCRRPARVHSAAPFVLAVDCEVCGQFKIHEQVSDELRRHQDHRLIPYLSAHLRQATDAAEEVLVTTENWIGFAQSHADTPVAQKLQKLLEYVGRHTGIGEWFYIGNEDRLAATADMRDPTELKFVLSHLNDRDLLTWQPIPPPPERQKPDGSYDAVEQALQLTVDGWDAVAPVVGGVAGTCFVAMSFDAALDDAYREGIRPAIEMDSGFRVIRVDRERHNENITDRIIAGIRSAQFVVADFTLQRQGVYYEAGFAQGLGRTVIRTCRADDFDRLHFDTRQFFHLKWDAPDDLRTKPADDTRATIGLTGTKQR